MSLIGDRASREKSKKIINEMIIQFIVVDFIRFFEFSAARPIETRSSEVLQQPPRLNLGDSR